MKIISDTCRECAGTGEHGIAQCVFCGGSGDEYGYQLYMAYLQGRDEVLAWFQSANVSAIGPEQTAESLKLKICRGR